MSDPSLRGRFEEPDELVLREETMQKTAATHARYEQKLMYLEAQKALQRRQATSEQAELKREYNLAIQEAKSRAQFVENLRTLSASPHAFDRASPQAGARHNRALSPGQQDSFFSRLADEKPGRLSESLRQMEIQIESEVRFTRARPPPLRGLRPVHGRRVAWRSNRRLVRRPCARSRPYRAAPRSWQGGSLPTPVSKGFSAPRASRCGNRVEWVAMLLGVVP
jgi:hypothetical protein